MHSVRIEPARLVFPDRCLRCGGPPSSAYMMPFGPKKAEVPVCVPCGKVRLRARVAWIAGGLVGAVIAVLMTALLLEVLIPFPEDAEARRIAAMIVALLILGVAGVVTWIGVRAALRRHRLAWDPVWVADASTNELAFRNGADARDVVATSYGLPVETSYREPAAQPVPYVPKGDPLDWLVPFVLALGGVAGLITRWQQLASGKNVSVTIIERVFFDLGGRWALVGFWLIVTLSLIAFAVALRSGRRDRTGEHL